ncbi:N-acetyltransferase [Lactobacillus sp. XV13L]|nr:N-acetyltransferase [Lactobacillus sp. XV13L]
MFISSHFTVSNLAVELALPELSHAQGLFDIVTHDRKDLARFLPWADKVKTVQDEVDFIKAMRLDTARYEKLALVVMVEGQPAGMADLHNISLKNERAEIGYWLGQTYQGRGVMTTAVQKLLEMAFADLGLHRLDLLADHNNRPSRAIAERLHFTHVALLKDEVKYHEHFCDMDLYTKINK